MEKQEQQACCSQESITKQDGGHKRRVKKNWSLFTFPSLSCPCVVRCVHVGFFRCTFIGLFCHLIKSKKCCHPQCQPFCCPITVPKGWMSKTEQNKTHHILKHTFTVLEKIMGLGMLLSHVLATCAALAWEQFCQLENVEQPGTAPRWFIGPPNRARQSHQWVLCCIVMDEKLILIKIVHSYARGICVLREDGWNVVLNCRSTHQNHHHHHPCASLVKSCFCVLRRSRSWIWQHIYPNNTLSSGASGCSQLMCGHISLRWHCFRCYGVGWSDKFKSASLRNLMKLLQIFLDTCWWLYQRMINKSTSMILKCGDTIFQLMIYGLKPTVCFSCSLC